MATQESDVRSVEEEFAIHLPEMPFFFFFFYKKEEETYF